ncbi:MAG: hypothetical protein PVH88_00935 [Ignavibacteria bacterium]|jgi:23S rRNA (adenine2030-N6)-methyltransferase
MPYTHFGKQADVWKHLALCEVITNEKPQVYIETNSANSDYSLDNTPEQQYGIYNFIDKASNYERLYKSKYFDLESVALTKNKYLGSPGLAMSLLGKSFGQFIFFDIETAPLINITEFANRNDLSNNIKTINQDSVIGVMDLLQTLPNSTLIHIDPYYIDKPSTNGYNYLDLFAKASEQGLMCFLWYGFNTLNDKKQINDFIVSRLVNCAIDNLSCVELIMEIIQNDSIPCNPGVLGSGLLTSNLSNDSLSAIMNFSELLVDLYKGTKYNDFKGDLCQEIIKIKNRQND